MILLLGRGGLLSSAAGQGGPTVFRNLLPPDRMNEQDRAVSQDCSVFTRFAACIPAAAWWGFETSERTAGENLLCLHGFACYRQRMALLSVQMIQACFADRLIDIRACQSSWKNRPVSHRLEARYSQRFPEMVQQISECEQEAPRTPEPAR